MTMTQVQFLPAPGQPGLGGQGPALPSGLEGLFAQLITEAQLTNQPLTTADAANIAQALPPEMTKNLPADPNALKDLLNKVKQALSQGDTASLATLLPGIELPEGDALSTLQNLPSQAVSVVRSNLVTFQPRELKSLIAHESSLLKQLGFENLELNADLDPATLTEAYIQAGLSPEEAAVRVDIITQMLDHLAAAPQQPLVLPVPTSVTAAASALEIKPLPVRPQDLLQAVQAAVQTVAPESEEVVSQILALDETAEVEGDANLEAASVQANLLQTQIIANPVAPTNEAKAAVDALVELTLPEKKLNLETRPVQVTVEAAATTAEGQIIDSALNEQPAAHLLASVERSQVTGGVATQSGAAVSLAPGYNQGDASTGGDGRRSAPEVDGLGHINAEASAASFDRFLGQKLETQIPTPATYNAQGKVMTPTEQVDISIRQLAGQGGGELRIKLSPEELGRVDIRLEIHNSQVRGVILVERLEVMQDLARDLKHLQQALTASGLTVADNALSFQMQNQGGDQGQSQNNSSRQGGLTEVAGVDDNGLPLPAGPWRDVTKLVDVNI